MSYYGSPVKANVSASSLHMSDLDGRGASSRLSMKSVVRQQDEDEFVRTIDQQNRQITKVRNEIQELMLKATGYARNSGLLDDKENPELTSSPPRYSGKSRYSAPASPYITRNSSTI